MLLIQGLSKTFNKGTVNEKTALKNLNLHLQKGDYAVLIGGNGSGKSTLLNCIAGEHSCDTGSIFLAGTEMSSSPEEKKAKFLGRVFQDPLKGTCPRLSLAENLALALRRGERRSLAKNITRKEKNNFQELLRTLNLGLENRLDTPVGLLSGGQRQALTLIMATLKEPQLLLLDEHTAALDPKTALQVQTLTSTLIQENKLTALMVTHNLKEALTFGNRLLMLQEGTLLLDVAGPEKRNLTPSDLFKHFSETRTPCSA